jgi:hypothetical protein
MAPGRTWPAAPKASDERLDAIEEPTAGDNYGWHRTFGAREGSRTEMKK